MAHRYRRSLIVVAVAVLALCVAAEGGATWTATIAVQAKVTFVKRGFEFRKLRLQITRSGRTWQSGPLGTTYFIRPKVRVRDLDADGEPEVWVDTYTGGAHCCFGSRLFRYVPARHAYAGTFHLWGNVGYRAKNIDGRGGVELMTSDDRFAYVFTSFAASAFPIQFWHFDHGRVIDVTRDFPGQIELDANALWRSYLRFRPGRDDPRGVLAAWMADQYLLGREEGGWATLESIVKRRELGPRPDLVGWPQGRAYLRALRAFLEKTGYAR
jgi:hypothetical protein